MMKYDYKRKRALLPKFPLLLAACVGLAGGYYAAAPASAQSAPADTIAPLVEFRQPKPNGFVNGLQSISGIAIDDAGVTNGNMVTDVRIFIRRNRDGRYWNGSTWVLARTALGTELREQQFYHSLGIAWTAPITGQSLPSGSQMGAGTFTITAEATDASGNIGRASMTVTSDLTAPSLSIVTPKDGTVVTNLVTTGYAREASTGSGVDRVRLTIQRHSDDKYWNGSAWVDPEFSNENPYPPAELLVGSYNNGVIREFSSDTGLPVRDFARNLKHPETILFGPDQTDDGYPELYVCDRDNNRVLFYNGVTRQIIGVFARGNDLRGPSGIAFMPESLDGDGYPDLLVANGYAGDNDADNARLTAIKRFDGRTRVFMGNFVQPNANGDVMNGFEDIVFGPDANNDGASDLYAAALLASKVVVYDGTTGEVIRNFVAPQAGGLRQPTGMRFGPDGNLYVCSANSDDIKVYNGTSGAFLRDFVADNNGQTFGLDGPERLVFGPDGNLYVSVFGTPTNNAGDGNAVLRFSFSANGQTGVPAPAPDQTGAIFANDGIPGPAGLAFNPIATGDFVPPPAPPSDLIIPELTAGYSSITGAFKRSSGLPTGTNLPSGRYTVMVTAWDRAGNRSALSSTVIVGVAPRVAITTPRSGSTISSLPKIDGTAQGEGVQSVHLFLRRNSDGKFWTGSGWGTRTALSTNLTPLNDTNGVKFERTGGLPSGANLTAGTYRLEAVATSDLGLTGTAVSEFTVQSSGGGDGSAEVKLSQASATAGTSTIRLVFTGALDAATAADPSSYVVAINGTVVNVERAIYSASARSVQLKVPAGALRAGDTVRVSFNLRDTAGRAVTGQSNTITAGQ